MKVKFPEIAFPGRGSIEKPSAKGEIEEVERLLQPPGGKVSEGSSWLTPLVALAVVIGLIWMSLVIWPQTYQIVTQFFSKVKDPRIQAAGLASVILTSGLLLGVGAFLASQRKVDRKAMADRIVRMKDQPKSVANVDGSGALGFERALARIERPEDLANAVVFAHPPLSHQKMGTIGEVNGVLIFKAPAKDALGVIQAAIAGRRAEKPSYQKGHRKAMAMIGGEHTKVEWIMGHFGEGHTSETCKIVNADHRTKQAVGADPGRFAIVVRDAPATEPDTEEGENPEGAAEEDGLSPEESDGLGVEPVHAMTQDVLDTAKNAVVRVQAGNSVGSGAFYNTRGFAFTAAHNVGDAEEVTITFSDGRTASAEVVGSDADADIAVLWCRGLRDAPVLPFADGVHLGQEVFALGYPLGAQTVNINPGVVSSLFPNDKGLAIVQTDAAINPGSSGCPLVDAQGRLVAVVTSRIEATVDERPVQSMGYALSVTDVAKVLRRLTQ